MSPLGLDESVSGARELFEERGPAAGCELRVRSAELEDLDAVVEFFDPPSSPYRQLLEIDRGQDLDLLCGSAAPAGAEQAVPQRDQRPLVLPRKQLVGPDGLVELRPVSLPLVQRGGSVVAASEPHQVQQRGQEREAHCEKPAERTGLRGASLRISWMAPDCSDEIRHFVCHQGDPEGPSPHGAHSGQFFGTQRVLCRIRQSSPASAITGSGSTVSPFTTL